MKKNGFKIAVILAVLLLVVLTIGFSSHPRKVKHYIDYDKNDLVVEIRTFYSENDYVTLDGEIACKLVDELNKMEFIENPANLDGIIGLTTTPITIRTKGKEYVFGYSIDNYTTYSDGTTWQRVCCDYSNKFFDIISQYGEPLTFFWGSRLEYNIVRFEVFPMIYLDDFFAPHNEKDIKRTLGHLNVNPYMNNVYLVERNVTYGQWMEKMGIKEYDHSLDNQLMIDLFINNNDNKLEYYKPIVFENYTIKVRKMNCYEDPRECFDHYLGVRDILVIKVNK